MDGVDSGMNRRQVSFVNNACSDARSPVRYDRLLPLQANTNQKELCLTKIKYSNKYKDYCIEPYTLYKIAVTDCITL